MAARSRWRAVAHRCARDCGPHRTIQFADARSSPRAALLSAFGAPLARRERARQVCLLAGIAQPIEPPCVSENLPRAVARASRDAAPGVRWSKSEPRARAPAGGARVRRVA